MIYRLIIEDNAEADLQSAIKWYENKRRGLGEEFLLAVEAALAEVRRHPESFSLVYRDVRRALVRRFPYGILLKIDDRIVRVIAVLHAKRNPAMWKRRGRTRR